MKLNNIQKLNDLNLFNWNSSLKEWNFKNLEWFLIKDWFYFNEYWKVETKTIISEFIKKNKKKGQFLYDLVNKGDISLNFTWHVTCASWLGYTLDKINFISLWYRKKIKMIEIFTEDNCSIVLTKKMKLLTNQGYKESQDIVLWEELIWILWNSYNWFKNGGAKNNFIDILNILISIKDKIKKLNIEKIQINKLEKKYSNYLNIIGINSSKKYISLEEIDILISSIEWTKEWDDSISKDVQDVLWNKEMNKNIFIRKITRIEEIEVLDAYIWSIVSKLALNYIVNNIILKK